MNTYYATIIIIIILLGLAQSQDYVWTDRVISNGNVAHTRGAKQFYILTACVLIFVAGFRYSVGADYWAYYRNIAKYASSFWTSLKSLNEPGINLVCKLVRIFTGETYIAMFVFALLTIGLSMIIIFKNTNCLFMAVMLYVFLGCWHSSFNAVRQSLASMIIFCGFSYLRDRKLWKYVGVVLIAFLFHRSAIIMIAPYFILHNKINYKNVILLITGTFVVLFSYERLLDFTEFILQDSLDADMEYAKRAVNLFRLGVAVLPAIFYLIMYAGKRLDDGVVFKINLVMVHAMVMVMSSNSAMLARVGIYTAPFCAIAMPELNKGFNRSNRQLVNIGMIALYAIYFFYDISSSDSLNHYLWVFPYI